MEIFVPASPVRNPPLSLNNTTLDNSTRNVHRWESVDAGNHHHQYPCARSLHTAAVWGDKLLIFGGKSNYLTCQKS